MKFTELAVLILAVLGLAVCLQIQIPTKSSKLHSMGFCKLCIFLFDFFSKCFVFL
jgi:hypothetical protein